MTRPLQRFAGRFEHVAQAVVGVGVVYDDVEILARIDGFETTGYAGQGRQTAGNRVHRDAQTTANRCGTEGIRDIMPAEQLQCDFCLAPGAQQLELCAANRGTDALGPGRIRPCRRCGKAPSTRR